MESDTWIQILTTSPLRKNPHEQQWWSYDSSLWEPKSSIRKGLRPSKISTACNFKMRSRSTQTNKQISRVKMSHRHFPRSLPFFKQRPLQDRYSLYQPWGHHCPWPPYDCPMGHQPYCSVIQQWLDQRFQRDCLSIHQSWTLPSYHSNLTAVCSFRICELGYKQYIPLGLSWDLRRQAHSYMRV